MVRLTRYTVRLITLCLLWAIVRSTQFLLKLCDRITDADAVSMAELQLSCDIQKMLEKAAISLINREKRWTY